jgi:hypothetical protein
LAIVSALSVLALLLLHLSPDLAAADGPTLIYRKVFKTSSPEFIEIKLKPTGTGTVDIRQLDDDADPQPFEISAGLATRLFQMAAELNHFEGQDLDVKRRLANLGEKTFRYENGGKAHEATFNYTLNNTAQQMMQVFEGLSRQQEHWQTLNHRLRFDRLGVNDALLKFEVDLNRKSIPEPDRLLPLLESIAADTRVVEIARQRARAVAERIRTLRPTAHTLRPGDFAG